MLGRIQRLAHPGDIAGDSGGSLVMAGEHSLDLVLLVRFQRLLGTLERHALAPLDILDFHVVSEPLRHVDPQMAELSEARGQHLVAGRQRIAQCRLPATGARGREDEYLTGSGLEDLLQTL